MTDGALLADERRLLILARLREQSVVRVRDLAEEFKTSQMTIRRDLVAMDAEGLLRQVHGGAVLARESAPSPGSTPRGLGHVGIVVPTANYYFATIINGCKETISDAGGTASVMVSDFDMARERALCEQFVATGARALVFAPTFTQDTAADVAEWLFDLPIPVVLLERDIADPATGRAMSSVRTAYEKGWETSLRHLRTHGHGRVALVTHGLRQVGVNLTTTWHQAARDAGYDPENALLLADPRVTGAPAQEVLDEIVDWIADTGATGVISHCDQATLGIVQTIRARGWRIPEDLSIVTNEDQIAQLTDPPLTSNSPVKLAVGRTAGRMAHDLMTDTTASIQHVLFQPNLTDRGSCAAPAVDRTVLRPV
ncbi:substrate-binding domain-containing protein [Occultella gossypii]|uniref:DeoR/GlpR family transcriptional regulator n=1 Tax=Occultella gossypii TaxID=2800820 RepID=A0ABS7S3D8_9MICO|nr:substrate-binding domain-containing protein [Occultella gossypii]MBZ2194852.1 DeoR/GlpR family transcriptional regulator [Occultella gossypii]